MKKGLKIGILSLASVLTLGGLVGCGGDDRIKISVWTTFNTSYQAIIDKAISRFEKKYPDYRIEYVKQTGSYDGLKDMVVKGVNAGAYPDVVVAYPDSVADFIGTGKALNIEPYMKNEEYGWTAEDLADIPEAYIKEGQSYMIPGTYSLPMCKSTEALYYDRALVGIDLSEYDDEVNDGEPLTDKYLQNLTWEELFDHLAPALIAYNDKQDDSHKLIKPNGKYADNWAVCGYDSDDNLFITLAEQYGYGYTSLDETTGIGSVDFVNDGMKGLMKKFNDAYVNRYFTTKGIVGANVNYLTTSDCALLSIGSTGGVGYQYSSSNPKDVGVGFVPQAEGKDKKLMNQGPSIAFMQQGANKEEIEQHAKGAWLFYKEWTEPDIALEWALQTGYSPIRTSVFTTDEYMEYADESTKTAATADILTARNAKYAASAIEYLFSSPVFSGSSKARTAVAGLTADCIKGKDCANSVLTDAKCAELFNNAKNNAIL